MDDQDFRRVWAERASIEAARACLIKEENDLVERALDIDILPRLRLCAKLRIDVLGPPVKGFALRRNGKATGFFVVLQSDSWTLIKRDGWLSAQDTEAQVRCLIDYFGAGMIDALEASLTYAESESTKRRAKEDSATRARKKIEQEPASNRKTRASPGVNRLDPGRNTTVVALSPGWTLCPSCQVPLKDRHLARHERKVHGKPTAGNTLPVSGQQAPKARGTAAKPRGTIVLRPTRVSQEVEPHMDASRGIGHVVRDHGHYGSHPSHDRMDDESDA
jgi:hypothetical protein